jgi:tRNA A-37 threonylcarbamoyl transferase component Bud32
METQNKQHPSMLHLAALALGKLKPDHATKVQSHLSECDECQQYLAKTPHSELAEIVRQAKEKVASNQNTMATGLSGTIAGVPVSPLGHQTPPGSSPSPGCPVEHAVSKNEIPDDLYAQSKYRIVRLLGRGGMGTVYEAEHVRMKRPVAIKVINPELVNHSQALARFEEEIRAVASLDHINIARAFDAESIGALQLFVMEFVRGQTLYDFLRARGRLSVVEACRCVRQALIGLQHAHESGLVHRDLKPQNLMLTRDTGQIKILDFGLAKAVRENHQSRGLTSSRATMGTYAYMAPEQALDAANADIRADIYGLGCTLYYLIAGVLPFDYDTDTRLLIAHQNESPRPLHGVCPEVPQELSDLVGRMLAKNPADRPQTPREAADALLPFARGQLSLAPAIAGATAPWSGAGRGIDRRLWGGIAAAFLALFGVGGWAVGLFSVRTPFGTIIVENAPTDADVRVDNQTVTVQRGSDTVTITGLKQGPHHLKIVRDGHELWSDDVTVRMGDQPVRVKFDEATATDTLASKSSDEQTKDAESASGGAVTDSAEATTSTEPIVKPPAIPRNVRVMRGVWRIEGDELVCEPVSGQRLILFGDPTWSDIDVTYQCKRSNHIASMECHFRDDNSANFNNFSMGGYGGTNNWCEIYCATRGKGWSADNRNGRGVELPADMWFSVRIFCRGDDLYANIDGKSIAHMKRADLPQGYIGFASGKDGVVRFKDIKVTAPDGAILWEGLPELTL